MHLKPSEPENYFNLGAQFQTRDSKVAEAYFRTALRHKPGYPEAYLSLAALFSSKQDTAAAVDAYKSAVRVAPRNAEIVAHAFVNIGSLLTDTATRLKYYKAAADAHPKHPQALNNVGMLTEAPREKESWFQRAIEAAPHFPDPHFNMGHLHHFTQPQRAMHHYRNALALRPNFPQARNNLAVLVQEGHGRR